MNDESGPSCSTGGQLRLATACVRRDAFESLMVVDWVLATTEITWLPTECDKLAHLTQTENIEGQPSSPGVPGRTSKTVPYFPDKLPNRMDRVLDRTFVQLQNGRLRS
jgi:hypothetical protein